MDVPGARLFAIGEGAGPPLVLIHAAIVDHTAWDAMVPGLVSAGYRVIRYDLRGFGASATEDVEFSDRADLRAVLDVFGVGRAAIVGNSKGGHIGLDTAIESPDRVVAVVPVGAGPGGFDGGATPLERAIFDDGDRVESASPRDPDAIADLLVRLWVDGPGQPATRVPAEIRETVRGLVRPLYQPGHVAGKGIPMTPPANDRLAELRCPVLAVAGGLDLSLFTEALKRLETAAPNARTAIWPDVAHMAGMEQPERLTALVTDFLAPLRPWD
ncbi:MAG: alpha/beta fold hydrolase [Candidatus Limnocylindrales bacterium]